MKKKYYFILILVAIIFYSGGYYTKLLQAKKMVSEIGDIAYNKCSADTKRRLENFGVTNISEINSNFHNSVIGDITALGAGKITISIKPLTILADSDFNEREVLVDESTKIEKISMKDEKVYQEDLNSFYSEHPEYRNIGEVAEGTPSRTVKSILNFSDLKVGQKITVYGKDDITNEKQFSATEIIVSE